MQGNDNRNRRTDFQNDAPHVPTKYPGTVLLRICAVVCCFAGLVTLAPAQTTLITSELQPAPVGIWEDGIGTGFRKGVVQAGFNVGGGFGVAAFGSSLAHDLVLGSINVGRMLSGVVAPDSRFAGNWELSGEVFGGSQMRPEYSYVVGGTGLIRYNFVTGSRWVPYLNAGVGMVATDIGRPDLGSVFNFDPQAGIGTHFFFKENVAVTVDLRWLHMSNAGIKQPNHGVNTTMFSLGLNWFF